MTTNYLLEISVESADAAVAAERAGADRIELCAELNIGGTTPAAELMRDTRARVKIPIFAMIRPRGGDFVYSPAELAQMCHDIELAKSSGMDGIVLGVLLRDNTVDVSATRELVRSAKPLPVTFHRAFDETSDLSRALQNVIATGATRILTSGGQPTALAGAAVLNALINSANQKITILPGGGINPSNLEEIIAATNATEFHSGLGSSIPYSRSDHSQFEREVSSLSAILKRSVIQKH